MKTYFPTSGYFDGDDPNCVSVRDDATGREYPLPFAGGRATHSPTGFAWGYHGSGPSELARAILADHMGRVPQPMMYHEFKVAFIATLNQDSINWTITSDTIAGWLEQNAHLGWAL